MNLISLLQSSIPVLISVTIILGLIVGSFLNVVIHRLPLMLEREWHSQCAELLECEGQLEPTQADSKPLTLNHPASSCPHCGHKIRPWENIPVLSYLILGAKCSSCKKHISIRYPVIEVMTAILSATIVWHFGFSAQAGFALILTWSLISLSMIDADHKLLPDSITLPVLWLGLIINLQEVFTDSHSSIVGAVAGYMSLWIIFKLHNLLTGKEGMGYGDFKLFALFGAWLGWQMLPIVILISSLAGSVVGLSLIMLKGHGRDTQIPFGPYIAVAGWICLIWGNDIMQFYLEFSGLS